MNTLIDVTARVAIRYVRWNVAFVTLFALPVICYAFGMRCCGTFMRCLPDTPLLPDAVTDVLRVPLPDADDVATFCGDAAPALEECSRCYACGAGEVFDGVHVVAVRAYR